MTPFLFLIYIYFIELYIFLCCPPFFSLHLLPSSITHMLPIYSGDLVCFHFLCRLDLCMTLLGSSLLSRFSGIVICSTQFYRSWRTYNITFSGPEQEKILPPIFHPRLLEYLILCHCDQSA